MFKPSPAGTSRAGTVRRIATKAVALVCTVLLLALAVAFLLRVKATRDFNEDHPPRGKLVDVGGFLMHIHCTGSGEPTVVLEAGYIDFSLVWSKVQPEVAEFARVCSYDRAGLLWSEPSPRPRSVDAVVDELATLLQAAGEPGPYVLVGHSLGGLVTTHFAHKHRNNVVGLVLVDATTHHSIEEVPEDIRPLRDPDVSLGQVRLARALSWLGVLRFVPGLGPPPESGLSAKTIAIYEASWGLLPRQTSQAIQEWDVMTTFADDVRDQQLGLGNLPLVYLLAGRPGRTPNEQWSAELLDRATALAARFADDTTRLSTRGSVVPVPEASHDIHLDEPREVIDAIRQVVGLGLATPAID